MLNSPDFRPSSSHGGIPNRKPGVATVRPALGRSESRWIAKTRKSDVATLITCLPVAIDERAKATFAYYSKGPDLEDDHDSHQHLHSVCVKRKGASVFPCHET